MAAQSAHHSHFIEAKMAQRQSNAKLVISGTELVLARSNKQWISLTMIIAF